jgi:hypothetical protein
MCKIYPLNLSFKGDRKYIHSSDVIPAIFDQIPDIKNNITIQFHKIARHPVIAFYIDVEKLPKLKKSGELCAILSYKSEDNSLTLIIAITEIQWLTPHTKAFNESQVIQGHKIIDKEILQPLSFSGNFYERVVALYKELLNQVISKEFWVLVRLDLISNNININALSIKIVTEIGGEMYKASVNGDGKYLGSIYFAKGVI